MTAPLLHTAHTHTRHTTRRWWWWCCCSCASIIYYNIANSASAGACVHACVPAVRPHRIDLVRIEAEHREPGVYRDTIHARSQKQIISRSLGCQWWPARTDDTLQNRRHCYAIRVSIASDGSERAHARTRASAHLQLLRKTSIFSQECVCVLLCSV